MSLDNSNKSDARLQSPQKNPPRANKTLPRHERWRLAQDEVDALSHTLTLSEFRTAQAAIWARWGL